MPPGGIEPPTFALQERRTTTVLKGLGTTDGNRTHVVRLEGEHSTTELRQLGRAYAHRLRNGNLCAQHDTSSTIYQNTEALNPVWGNFCSLHTP